MRQSLRLYKNHDTDLIALQTMGVSISKLAKQALESYANGRHIKMSLPDCRLLDIPENRFGRSDFVTKDKKAIRLLQSIKRGKRTQFIKTLIRSCLLTQSLSVFFTKNEDVIAEKTYIDSLDSSSYDLIDIPASKKSISFPDMVKDHEEKKKKSRNYRELDSRGEIDKIENPISPELNITGSIPESYEEIAENNVKPMPQNEASIIPFKTQPGLQKPAATSDNLMDGIISAISDIPSTSSYIRQTAGAEMPQYGSGSVDMLDQMVEEF